MASESSLSGSVLPADPTTPLGAATMQYVDVRTGLIQNDQVHYGDYWSTMPRALTTATRSVGNGVIAYQGGVAADTFTATRMRFFIFGASSGTGTIQAKVFTGTVQTSLTPVASITNLTSGATQTLVDVALSASVSITPGLLVYVGILTTGFTTPPTMQCMNGSGGPAPFISPTGRVWVANSATGQTAIPSAAISMASQTAGGNPLWCALL